MREYSALKLSGLIIGILVFSYLYFFVTPPESLSENAWKVIACAAFMLIWWITEAVPIPVTALAPVIFFPLMGVSSMKEAAVSYGSPMIFLFLGGFLLATAMERWQLHIRIALNIVRLVGTNANTMIGGFMLATAILSMWMSNTATTVMMLPIAISMIDLMVNDAKDAQQRKQYERFFIALMLGIAYGANIGGMATLIGTPPNIIFSGFMSDQFGVDVNFLQWMAVGVPVAIVLLFLTWQFLTRICFRNRLGELHGGKAIIQSELQALGKMSRAEKMVLFVFGITALFWVLRSTVQSQFVFLQQLSDASIAIMGACLLFILPAENFFGKRVMDWQATTKLPWGILLLFGGGLSLAGALENNGVIAWLGDQLSSLEGLEMLIIVLSITAVVVFMTEFMSNMALTAVFLPIAAALAIGFNENPLLLALPATLAASCAFMLPMATPPNGIIFGSGHVTIAQMARAGFALNILSILVISFAAFTLLSYVFDVNLGVVPDWAIKP